MSFALPSQATGAPRGFGFVTFREPGAAEAVLSSPMPHRIDSRIVDPKPLNLDLQQPRVNKIGNRKLFVGGLAPAVAAVHLVETFSVFGVVQDAVVMMDRDTNR